MLVLIYFNYKLKIDQMEKTITISLTQYISYLGYETCVLAFGGDKNKKRIEELQKEMETLIEELKTK